jgi:hypothetical protein
MVSRSSMSCGSFCTPRPTRRRGEASKRSTGFASVAHPTEGNFREKSDARRS